MIDPLVKIILLIFVSIGTLSCSNQGINTYFISPVGDDKNSGKSNQEPFKTIQHAINLARAGDTITLLSGEYYEDIKSVRAGKKEKPIKIMGSSDAILKGKSKVYVAEIQHSYIEFSDFTIDGKIGSGESIENFRDKLIYIKGQKDIGVEGIKILNMKLQNALGECLRLKYFASHNEVAYTSITNCGVRDFAFLRGKKNGEAIYIGTAANQVKEGKNPTKDVDTSSYNWIHHNTISTSGECVDMKEGTHHNIIEYNSCTKQADTQSGAISVRGNNNTIQNNKIFDNLGSGIRIGGHGINDGINNKVCNNYLNNNAQGALKIMIGTTKNKICDNNIIVRNKQKRVRIKKGQHFIFKRCKDLK